MDQTSNKLTSSSSVSQPTLTLSQLLLYNSSKRYKENATDIVRHSQQRETPLPIYLDVILHTKTRKRDLVDTLFHRNKCSQAKCYRHSRRYSCQQHEEKSARLLHHCASRCSSQGTSNCSKATRTQQRIL